METSNFGKKIINFEQSTKPIFSEDGLREFYANGADTMDIIWQGSLHPGLFKNVDMSLPEAAQAMNELMTSEAQIESGSQVLVLGCGTGGLDRFIVRNKHAKVIGLDLSEAQLKLAKERAKDEGLLGQIEYFQGSMTKIPLDDNSVYSVLAQASFFYCEPKTEAIAEIYRVLKTGGILVIEDAVIKNPKVEDEVKEVYMNQIGTNELWTPEFYKEMFKSYKLFLKKSTDLSTHLATTYRAIIKSIKDNRTAIQYQLTGDHPTEFLLAKAKFKLDRKFAYPEFLKLVEEGKLGCQLMVFQKYSD